MIDQAGESDGEYPGEKDDGGDHLRRYGRVLASREGVVQHPVQLQQGKHDDVHGPDDYVGDAVCLAHRAAQVPNT